MNYFDDRVLELVAAYRDGDQDAARDLHDRYAQRLLQMVRGRLNPTFNRRMDPEDVVQSAFRSFFRVVRKDGWVDNANAENVWGLLAAITINKLNARVRHHRAGKRSVIHESNAPQAHQDQNGFPEIETIFREELAWVIENQTERHQAILQKLLGGASELSVAEAEGCTQRTVYRVLERAIQQLQNRLGS